MLLTTKSEKLPFIQKLPPEIIGHLLDGLDLLSVQRLRCVSHYWNSLLNSYISGLKVLYISRLVPPDLPASNALMERLFSSPANKWTSLECLIFDGNNVDIEPLSLDVIAAVFKSCPALSRLIIETEVVNDERHKKVAHLEKAVKLRFFRWFGWSRYGKRFEQIVCQAAPTLLVAHLHALPATHLVSLRQLVLERWPPVAESNGGSLAQAWSRMPLLESLVVYFGRRANATRHLKVISVTCRRLTELVVVDSDLLDVDIALLNRLELSRLDLLYNYLLTDDGVSSLIETHSNLLSLGLSAVINLSNKTLTAIAKHCHKLEQLAVCGCPEIDLKAVEAFALARVRVQLNNSDLSLAWLTVYVTDSKVNVKRGLSSETLLARARLRLVSETDESKPMLVVPLRA